MATPYSQTAAVYADDPAYAGYRQDRREDHRHHASAGATIATWVFWALAAVFWGASLTTGLGIVDSVMSYPAPTAGGGADAGGVGFLLMDVIGGMVILGLALAWGVFRNSTRDKRNDVVTEAATHELYDAIERNGGEDLTTRSPEAHTAAERASYRPSQGPLH